MAKAPKDETQEGPSTPEAQEREPLWWEALGLTEDPQSNAFYQLPSGAVFSVIGPTGNAPTGETHPIKVNYAESEMDDFYQTTMKVHDFKSAVVKKKVA